MGLCVKGRKAPYGRRRKRLRKFFDSEERHERAVEKEYKIILMVCENRQE